MTQSVGTEAPAAFFSYCREDSDFALRLAADLKAAGANVWLDQLDIVPGQRWDRAVEDALTTCRRMLVILSPASVNSTNVMDEVSFALEEHKTVIPVLYQSCTIPFRVRRVQHVDFRQDYARGLQGLLKILAPKPVPADASLAISSNPSHDLSGVVESRLIEEQGARAEEASESPEEIRPGEQQQPTSEGERAERERQLAIEQARRDEDVRARAEQARLNKEREKAAHEQRKQRERQRAAEQTPGEKQIGTRTEPTSAAVLRELVPAEDRAEPWNKFSLEQASQTGFLAGLSGPVRIGIVVGGGLIVSVLLWVLLGPQGQPAVEPNVVRQPPAAQAVPEQKPAQQPPVQQSQPPAEQKGAEQKGAERTSAIKGERPQLEGVSGPLLLSLVGHSGGLDDASFSPDGRRIVTASDDRTARIWDASSGKLLTTLKGHTNIVGRAVFSSDGRRIITSSSNDVAIKVWDADSGALQITVPGTFLKYAALSSDGRRVVTFSVGLPSKPEDHWVRVWDLASGQLLARLDSPDMYSIAVFSPDGQRIVTYNATPSIWNATSGTRLFVLRGHATTANTATFSPDGQSIVTTSSDGTARVWNVADGKSLATLQGHTGSVVAAEFSPDGQLIVTGGDDGTARVWNASTGQPLATLVGSKKYVLEPAFSPDGRRVVGVDERTLRVWSSANGRLLAALQGHTGGIRRVAFSPDGQRIVSASDDRTARVWKTPGGERP